MKTLKSQTGSVAVIGLILIAAMAVVAFFGYRAWSTHRPTGSMKATASPTASPDNAYAGWKMDSFAEARLSLRHPASWQANTDPSTKGLLLTKMVGSGKLVIRLEFADFEKGLSAADVHTNKPVANFKYGMSTAYLVADAAGGMYSLSSCQAPGICYYISQAQPHSNIDESLTYQTAGGAQSEVALPNNPADIAEAVKIMSTLLYQKN
jgi:hypothetical protein